MTCAVATGLPLSPFPPAAATAAASVADPGFASAVDAVTVLAAADASATVVGTTLPTALPLGIALTMTQVPLPAATVAPAPASTGDRGAVVATSDEKAQPPLMPPPLPQPQVTGTPADAAVAEPAETGSIHLAVASPLRPKSAHAATPAIRADAASVMPPAVAPTYRAPLDGMRVTQADAKHAPATTDLAEDTHDSAPTDSGAHPLTVPSAVPDTVPLAAGLAPDVATAAAREAGLAAPEPRGATGRVGASAGSVAGGRAAAGRRRQDSPSPVAGTADVAASTVLPVPAPAAALATTTTGGDAATTPDAATPRNPSAIPTASVNAAVPASTLAPSPDMGVMIAAASIAPPQDHTRPAPSSLQPTARRDGGPALVTTVTPAQPGIAGQPAPLLARAGASDTASPPTAEHRDGPAPIVVAADRAPSGGPDPAFMPVVPLPGSSPGIAAKADGAMLPTAAPEPLVTARHGQIGQELGVQIASRLSDGGDQLVVRLVPAELGRIEVHMSFDERGGLRAVIAADSPVALDMLRRDSADLSRSLTDAGVRSDANSLRFQTDSSGGGTNGQPRSPWLQAETRSNRAGRDDPSTGVAEPTPYRHVRTSGRYDLFA